jgi:hypothetical protein
VTKRQNNQVFVLGKPFLPIIIFVSKAGACQIKAPLRCFSVADSSPHSKTSAQAVKALLYTSLFCLSIGDEEKKLNKIDTRTVGQISAASDGRIVEIHGVGVVETRISGTLAVDGDQIVAQHCNDALWLLKTTL